MESCNAETCQIHVYFWPVNFEKNRIGSWTKFNEIQIELFINFYNAVDVKPILAKMKKTQISFHDTRNLLF